MDHPQNDDGALLSSTLMIGVRWRIVDLVKKWGGGGGFAIENRRNLAITILGWS